jgi:hypothetical protein
MPVTDLTGGLPPVVEVYADDTDMDPARVASWPERARSSTAPVAFDLGHRADITTPPIKLRAGRQAPGTTIIGGIVSHHPTVEPTWSQWHENVGLVAEVPVRIIGTRFSSLGDGVSLPGGPALILGCWFDNIHDDAVEADGKHPCLVDSCVLDGVHIAFSAESGAAAAPGSVFRVANTMVRLRPQVQSYKPLTYGYGQHGPFWKWDPNSPAPEVRDSIFRADTRPSYNRSLHLPDGATGENVILIGTEAWTDDEVASWADQIDGVTFGTVEDWDHALAVRSAVRA